MTALDWYQTYGDARYRALAARFRPVFERIAEDAAERERAGARADAQLGWLFDAGFGALRIPPELGGHGARLSDVLRLIGELAAVDPNLAHLWRNHFSFGEDRLHAEQDERAAAWLGRIANGELIGGGWSELGAGSVDETTTTIRREAEGWRVSGRKYYSTGSIYARWITVLARTPEGTLVVAVVDTRQPGVEIVDDWDGFGQRLTGSGSVIYRDAVVADDDVIDYRTRYAYQAHYYQSAINALLVGIGRAVVRDGVRALRGRGRSHPNNVSPVAREDPQLLEALGRVWADVVAAEAVFERSLQLIDELADAPVGSSPGRPDGSSAPGTGGGAGGGADAGAAVAGWAAVAQAQLVATENVLVAATRVFDALGASGVSSSLQLDRHWRNARTLASHNPRVARARILGDWLVNGVDPLAPRIVALSLVGPVARGLATGDAGALAALRRLHDEGLVDVIVLGADALADTDRPAHPVTIDPASVIAARHGVFPGWGFLATATPTRDHPYNIARRILALDHLTGGRVGLLLADVDHGLDVDGGIPWLDGAAPGAEVTAEAASVIRRLWNSWPRASLIADREQGVFADVSGIRRIDHEGRYRVTGPLGTPSGVDGEPLLAAWVAELSATASPGAAPASGWAEVLLGPGARPEEGRTWQLHTASELAELDPDVLRARRPHRSPRPRVHGSPGLRRGLRALTGVPERSLDLSDRPAAFDTAVRSDP